MMAETLLTITTNDDGSLPIHQYSHQNDEWTTWTTLEPDQKRYIFGVVLMGSELITAGGYVDIKVNNTVVSTNIKTKSSKSLNPMEIGRLFPSLVVLNDDIYAVGGEDIDENWVNSVERWNRGTGKWSQVAPMIEKRADPRAAILKDKIYVIGGDTMTMECYDPHTNAWTLKASMHEKHDEPGFAALNDYLYAVGGYESTTVERYHYETNTWTMICSLSSPVFRFGCIALNDRIIAAGGYNDCKFLTTVQEYDPIANVWTRKSDLNIGGPCSLLLFNDTS